MDGGGERYLQPLEVILFFLDNGGQATNLELVNHFRHLLAKTEIGQENHAYLKRFTLVAQAPRRVVSFDLII